MRQEEYTIKIIANKKTLEKGKEKYICDGRDRCQVGEGEYRKMICVHATPHIHTDRCGWCSCAFIKKAWYETRSRKQQCIKLSTHLRRRIETRK